MEKLFFNNSLLLYAVSIEGFIALLTIVILVVVFIILSEIDSSKNKCAMNLINSKLDYICQKQASDQCCNIVVENNKILKNISEIEIANRKSLFELDEDILDTEYLLQNSIFLSTIMLQLQNLDLNIVDFIPKNVRSLILNHTKSRNVRQVHFELEVPANIEYLLISATGGGGKGSDAEINLISKTGAGGGGASYLYLQPLQVLPLEIIKIAIGMGGDSDNPDGEDTIITTANVVLTVNSGKAANNVMHGNGGKANKFQMEGYNGQNGDEYPPSSSIQAGGNGGSSTMAAGGIGATATNNAGKGINGSGGGGGYPVEDGLEGANGGDGMVSFFILTRRSVNN